MSQDLTPISNGEGLVALSPSIITAPLTKRRTSLSPQYREVKGLRTQPTAWSAPIERPIYRRLPAVGETYQVDFWADGDIGYVFIPLGNDQFGPGSIFVSQSEDGSALLIYDGVVVWKEGTTPVYKTIVDFRELGLQTGRFLVAYQLIYDDSPQPLPFQVEDFSLAGQDFSVSDSASYNFSISTEPNGNGWPNPGINAFAPTNADIEWKNYLEPVNQIPQKASGVIPGIAPEYQPVQCWLQWESPLPWKLNQIRVPVGVHSEYPPATLLLLKDGEWVEQLTTTVQTDENGQYYEFLTDTDPQTAWRIEWPFKTKMSVQGITVSGILTLLSKPSTPRARTQLAIYPDNLVPSDETLCQLAIINVNNYVLQRGADGYWLKEDIRYIATRDYEPVSDWLTQFWDSNLTSMRKEVETYAVGYMSPEKSMVATYATLIEAGLDIDTKPPDYPPIPEETVAAQLEKASVTILPIIDFNTLAGATVTIS